MSIIQEINQANYWEHFKYAKDLAMIYPIDHPKRIRIEKAVNEIQTGLAIRKEGK